MSTTDLLIEHLITGIQTAIWIILLSLTFSGIDETLMEFLKANETLVLFLTMALIYPLGIFVDNLSDKLLDWKDKQIRDKEFKDKVPKDLSVSKVLLYAQDDKLSDFYAYIRMRIRISRSTFVNFGIKTPARQFTSLRHIFNWHQSSTVPIIHAGLVRLKKFFHHKFPNWRR